MRTTVATASDSTAAQHAALADHFDKACRIPLGAMGRPEPNGNRVVVPVIERSIPAVFVERYRQDEFSRVDVTV